MIKKYLMYIIYFSATFLFVSFPTIAGNNSLDSLIDEIKSTFNKNYKIEQSGTGKVDMLEYSASVFRKSSELLTCEEYSFKSKKFDYVVRVGKYYKRIALGIYHFNKPEDIKKVLNDFLEGHEVNPQKFFKEGKHPALSPPFLILMKGNTLIFFYAKCEDIPRKKEWDKFTEPYINMFRKHVSENELIRCYCSGPVFIVK